MNLSSIKENLVFLGVFSGLLFIIRVTINFLSGNHWVGGVGILSLVTFSLFYLSNKNKLGYIGFVIKKRIIKRSKGKTFKFFFITSVIMAYIFGLQTIAVLVTNSEITDKVVQIENSQGYYTTNDFLTKTPTTTYTAPTIITSMIILYTPNPVSFAIMSAVNKMSNGLIFSFASVFFVEELEFLGIVLFFRLYPNKMNEGEIKT